MIPVADFFNYRLKPEQVKAEMHQGILTLTSKTKIKKGQQIFASYSSIYLNTQKSLLNYGFVSPLDLEKNYFQYEMGLEDEKMISSEKKDRFFNSLKSFPFKLYNFKLSKRFISLFRVIALNNQEINSPSIFFALSNHFFYFFKFHKKNIKKKRENKNIQKIQDRKDKQ